ncbi:MAG: glycosyltransferase [Blastocatellales bacterium]|nr:glycosyltransferase [Blastocatellales bacterium]
MQGVSVIIPTYNQASFLGEAIESALMQTLPPREVIVIDDGSSDGTARVLAGFEGRIRAMRQANRGVAAARNAGARTATGDALAFLDSDDRWLPEKLERQAARLEAETDLGLVHAGFEEIDADGAVLNAHLDGREGWVAEDMLLFDGPVILGGGSGVMIPRRVFQEAGGFDERLSTSADWDLYYRIAAGYRIGFIDRVLLQYRRHGANMHGNVRAMEHDMLLAYEKAFGDEEQPPAIGRWRCYGNLHTVLAGGFFAAGEYRKFFTHAVKGVCMSPRNFVRYLDYPRRRLNRSRKRESAVFI